MTTTSTEPTDLARLINAEKQIKERITFLTSVLDELEKQVEANAETTKVQQQTLATAYRQSVAEAAKKESNVMAAEMQTLRVSVDTYSKQLTAMNTIIDKVKPTLDDVSRGIELISASTARNQPTIAKDEQLYSRLSAAVEDVSSVRVQLEAMNAKVEQLTQTVKEHSGTINSRNDTSATTKTLAELVTSVKALNARLDTLEAAQTQTQTEAKLRVLPSVPTAAQTPVPTQPYSLYEEFRSLSPLMMVLVAVNVAALAVLINKLIF